MNVCKCLNVPHELFIRCNCSAWIRITFEIEAKKYRNWNCRARMLEHGAQWWSRMQAIVVCLIEHLLFVISRQFRFSLSWQFKDSRSRRDLFDFHGANPLHLFTYSNKLQTALLVWIGWKEQIAHIFLFRWKQKRKKGNKKTTKNESNVISRIPRQTHTNSAWELFFNWNLNRLQLKWCGEYSGHTYHSAA